MGARGKPMSAAAPAVMITGGAKRVGREIALDFARHGWAVGIHFRNSEAAAHELVAQIRAEGGRAVALRADLANEDQVERLLPAATAALGPLRCLVNNASTFERDEALDATRASWDLHLESNLRAPFVLIQHFARQLERGAEGNVINIIDERVWNLTPHFLSYTLSKAALWTLTQTLAPALAPTIRINAVGPGPVLPSVHQSAASFNRLCATLPLQRGTSPEEICRAIHFILAAPAMTGQMIALDGGKHLGWLMPDQDDELAQS
jgi:NAD(P)-dependent dehydrogenase (short-subunit alcohol dehydrogenase family)